ncbi:hypothetical protein KGP26_29980 (plasmid) [Serratia sp. JSRIV002]|uniref:hypothetical protein n=1 Tax=Serratia sp. JSRIV002 TaxID=2831894 RepID=UPI001CBF39ED|nr:hypothetical protein [Serratia sp. JSRIV002]UAN54691.1 hypothetical protein KGP26_29980 [Serratia sp. JSRIV002]
MPARQINASDTLLVIDAIESASARELDVLSDIHRAIIGRIATSSADSHKTKLQDSNASILASIARRERGGDTSTASVNRSQLHDLRNISGELKISISPEILQIGDSGNQKSSFGRVFPQESVAAASFGEINSKLQSISSIVQPESIGGTSNLTGMAGGATENHHFVIGNTARKWQLNDGYDRLNKNKKQTDNGVTGPRDSSGRFVSRDKVEAGTEKKKDDQEKSLIKRLSAFFSNKSGDGSTGEVAGMAAGGVLYSAGKEAAGLVGGVNSSVVSLKEWRDKRKERASAISGEPLRFPGMASASAPTKSQQAYSSNTTNKVVSVLTSQQEQLAKSDEEIIRILGDIRDKSSKGAGGGRGIIGSILSALGGRAIGRALGSRIMSGIAMALGGGALVKLFKRLAGVGPGSTTSRGGRGRSSAGGTPDKAKPRTKAGRPKAKGGKLAKIAAGAGGLAAGTYGAIKGVFSGGANDDAAEIDKPEPKKKEPKRRKSSRSKRGRARARITTATRVPAGAAATTAAKVSTGVAAGAAGAAGVAATTAAKTATGAAAAGTSTAAAKAATTAAQAPASAAATTAAKVATESTGKAAGEKLAGKAAGKLAAKGALKAIPIIGTVIGAGLDAADGYADEEAQRSTFKLADDQKVSGRHKTEYAAANIVDMGGLVSGASGLLADGARAVGLDGVAESLTFSTSDIAQAIDTRVSEIDKSIDNGINSVKSFFDPGKDGQVIDAIRAGANKTADAVKELDKSLKGMFSGPGGENPAQGEQPAVQGVVAPVQGVGSAVSTVPQIKVPQTNNVSNDLNIGGANARNRTFRNNNFGNLQFVGQEGAELEAPNAKGEQRFAKFDSPEEGFRALANQLSSYAEGTSKAVGYQKLDTVRGIITKFAPKDENDTEGYIKQLSKTLGVRESDRLDLANADVMTKVMRQVATIEGGAPQVSDEFIKNAIGQRSGRKWVGEFNPETLGKINEKRQAEGLAAISHKDQFSRPEKRSVGSRTSELVSEVAGAAVSGYDTATTYLGELAGKSDSALTDLFNVDGLAVVAPDRGLTLPVGAKLPPGLQTASKAPDAIGALQRKQQTTSYDSAPGVAAGIGERQPPVVDGTRSLPMGVVPYSSVKKVQKVQPGGQGTPQNIADAGGSSWWDGFSDVVFESSKTALEGTARNVLQSVGVDIDNPLGSFAATAGDTVGGGVSSVVSELMANTPLSFLSDTVSGMLGEKSNSLTQQAIGAFQSTPPPVVPNLAASGVAPVYQRDNESRNSDDSIASLLERIAKGVEKQLNMKPETKETSGNVNATTHSPQPVPRAEVPVEISDSALERLFG